MKFGHSLLVMPLLLAMLAMFSCTDQSAPIGPEEGHNVYNPDSEVPVDISGVEIPEGTLTVKEALEICKTLSNNETTDAAYYVKGYVRSLVGDVASGIAQYGNISFMIVDDEFAQSTREQLECYQMYNVEQTKFVSASQLKARDFVVIYGKLTNYNGTYETEGKGNSYVYASTNEKAYAALPKAAITFDNTIQQWKYMEGNAVVENPSLEFDEKALLLTKEGAGVVSPVFAPVSQLKVSFVVHSVPLNSDFTMAARSGENSGGKNGKDGDNVLLVGYDKDGKSIVSATTRVILTKDDKGNTIIANPNDVMLEEDGIVQIGVFLDSYVYSETASGNQQWRNISLESIQAIVPLE